MRIFFLSQKRNTMVSVVFFLFLLSVNASAQTDVFQRFDFGTFTLDLPESCDSYPNEQSEECVCVRTSDKSFFCIISAFTLEKNIDMEKQLREEAMGFNIDIDQSGLFAITTGKKYPLLCTMEDLGKAVMLIGIYPDYKNNRGIYINLLTTNKFNASYRLTEIISSFRLADK